MSRERELLNRCAVTLKARDICPLLLKEVSELLNEPEQKQLTPREALAEYKKGYMIGYYIAVRDLKQKVDSVFKLIMEEEDE